MSTFILIISILAWIASTIVSPQPSFVNAQYLIYGNTTGLNITNSTGEGSDNHPNSTTSNTQTSSGQGEDDKGNIASAPNCKGSALCPD
ncbi:MAG TPA: hypothetical protein VH481_11355 [Nitrososphaeraceae archaeon]